MAGQRRYPGATPFTSKQEKIFYGRDKDIDKLLTLIRVEKKILLYSKSGLGKTSLLEAGVLPKLPENYVTISIRLYAYKTGAETPVQRVINALKAVVGDLDLKKHDVVDNLVSKDTSGKTLWYYFKKAQLIQSGDDQEKQDKIFLLFFDQFEELFSFPQQDIDEFKNQIHELTELNIPDRIAATIAEARQNNRNLYNRELLAKLHHKADIRTVFAIRSDRLSMLNKLSDKIPDIQSTFYELQPLELNQARQAIVNPAADPAPVFLTKPFTFHEDAISKIINELSDAGTQNIETTQLQIVCHRIEEIAAQKSNGNTVQITVEDLPEFKNIFLNFYFDSINKLDEKVRASARRLVEDELIRNQQRISLDQEICKEYVDEPALRTLVDTHLLRAERNTFGRFSYEISHDTLVEPILESQKKYLDEQEKIRLEHERLEELRKLKEQQEKEAREREEEMKRLREEQQRKERERQRQIRQQRTIIVIVSVFLLISIALGLFGYRNMLEAQEQKKIAEKNLRDYKISEFSKNYREGYDFELNAEYQEALDRYTLALGFFDSLDVRQRIAHCQVMVGLKDTHQEIIAKAEELARNREYIEAMKVYNEALERKYDSLGVQRKRRDLYQRATVVFEKDLSDYQEMRDQIMIDTTRRRIERLNAAYRKFE